MDITRRSLAPAIAGVAAVAATATEKAESSTPATKHCFNGEPLVPVGKYLFKESSNTDNSFTLHSRKRLISAPTLDEIDGVNFVDRSQHSIRIWYSPVFDESEVVAAAVTAIEDWIRLDGLHG